MKLYALPELLIFLDKQTEVYILFDIENGSGSNITDSCVCQVKIYAILTKRNQPTVKMLWDAMSDCIGYEGPETIEQTLLPSEQSKNCDNV